MDESLLQIKSDIDVIFKDHLKTVNDYEGHGFDLGEVFIIRRELMSVQRDIERYFQEKLT
jgi:hypothetical protein